MENYSDRCAFFKIIFLIYHDFSYIAYSAIMSALVFLQGKMKGDLEYAGHTHKAERRSPVVSGLGVIAITGLLIAVTTAGVIFGVHLLNRIDQLAVSSSLIL